MLPVRDRPARGGSSLTWAYSLPVCCAPSPPVHAKDLLDGRKIRDDRVVPSPRDGPRLARSADRSPERAHIAPDRAPKGQQARPPLPPGVDADDRAPAP